MRFLVSLAVMFVFSLPSAFACGGPAQTEAFVSNHSLVKTWHEKFEAAVGEKLILKEVKMAGNDVLNIDMKVVARAMCAANYIYPYFRTPDNKVVCYAALESAQNGQLVVHPQASKAGRCRLANMQMLDFDK